VKAGGTTAVRAVSLDRPNATPLAVIETQYPLPSRKAFDTCLRDHAQALRADGLKHFPTEAGTTYERQIAEIAAEPE
jgi:hypothetical protein